MVEKGALSSGDGKLCLLTLTFELETNRVKVNQHVKSKIIFKSYCPDTHTHTHTHTHTGATARPGPLKWSVKTGNERLKQGRSDGGISVYIPSQNQSLKLILCT